MTDFALFTTPRMTDPGRIHRITRDRFRQLMAVIYQAFQHVGIPAWLHRTGDTRQALLALRRASEPSTAPQAEQSSMSRTILGDRPEQGPPSTRPERLNCAVHAGPPILFGWPSRYATPSRHRRQDTLYERLVVLFIG